ncbi:MAG TPA: histidine kinase [Acidobacteriota bacterium]|jgi:sensor histidine kinase YesM|nr:histidine kinase [Acidobacteriota bacterium]
MHPIFASIERLVLYLIAWVPLAALLVFLLVVSTDLRWMETILLALPLIALYAFLCLSAWYLCQNPPSQPADLIRLMFTYVLAALICGSIWMATAKAIGLALGLVPAFAGLSERLKTALPLLLVMGALLYLLSLAVHYVLLALERSREMEANEMRARVLARDAELKALKTQLNPHFLFNSLNSISALTSIDPTKARQMCVLLSDFLRSTLGMGEKAGIRFSEELSLVRSFLAIQQVRFGSRLRLEEQIDADCDSYLLPPLLLQPLVENAVIHGLADLVEDGWVRLEARRSGNVFLIAVENTFDPNVPTSQRDGIGLSNVRRTLRARYCSNASLDTEVKGARFRVELTLPIEV